jgi:MFS family permease
VFGGLTANQRFLDFFHGTNDGEWAALNSAMYQIGGVCALFFVGPAIDTWGRKIGMQIGAWIIIIGTILNGTAALSANLGQLKAGRFILGFGVSIVSAAGPIYVVETAHPAYRGIITAYCNTFWFTGSILASGAIRGAITLEGNISWTIPVYLQMFFPGLIVLLAWFIPESPRWLYVNHKREKAVAVLTKYHGYGNEDSAWVKLQLEEYESYLNMYVSFIFTESSTILTHAQGGCRQALVGLPPAVQHSCKPIPPCNKRRLLNLRTVGW